jgi:hypothetical protein
MLLKLKHLFQKKWSPQIAYKKLAARSGINTDNNKPGLPDCS